MDVEVLNASNAVIAQSEVSSASVGFASFDTMIATLAWPAELLQPAHPGLDASDIARIRVTLRDLDTPRIRAQKERAEAERQRVEAERQRAAEARAKDAAIQREAERQRAKAEAETRRAAAIRGKKWPQQIEQAVIAREISIGMTTEQVMMAWGKPESLNETITASGKSEQWVYGGGQYLYFENGILRVVQRSR